MPPTSTTPGTADTFTIRRVKHAIHGKRAPLQLFGPARLWVQTSRMDGKTKAIPAEPCEVVFKCAGKNSPRHRIIGRIHYLQEKLSKEFKNNPSQLNLDQGHGVTILEGELENESEIMEQLEPKEAKDEPPIDFLPDKMPSSIDLPSLESPLFFQAPAVTTASPSEASSARVFSSETLTSSSPAESTIAELQKRLADKDREIHLLKNSLRELETASSELLQYVAQSQSAHKDLQRSCTDLTKTYSVMLTKPPEKVSIEWAKSKLTQMRQNMEKLTESGARFLSPNVRKTHHNLGLDHQDS